MKSTSPSTIFTASAIISVLLLVLWTPSWSVGVTAVLCLWFYISLVFAIYFVDVKSRVSWLTNRIGISWILANVTVFVIAGTLHFNGLNQVSQNTWWNGPVPVLPISIGGVAIIDEANEPVENQSELPTIRIPTTRIGLMGSQDDYEQILPSAGGVQIKTEMIWLDLESNESIEAAWKRPVDSKQQGSYLAQAMRRQIVHPLIFGVWELPSPFNVRKDVFSRYRFQSQRGSEEKSDLNRQLASDELEEETKQVIELLFARGYNDILGALTPSRYFNGTVQVLTFTLFYLALLMLFSTWARNVWLQTPSDCIADDSSIGKGINSLVGISFITGLDLNSSTNRWKLYSVRKEIDKDPRIQDLFPLIERTNQKNKEIIIEKVVELNSKGASSIHRIPKNWEASEREQVEGAIDEIVNSYLQEENLGEAPKVADEECISTRLQLNSQFVASSLNKTFSGNGVGLQRDTILKRSEELYKSSGIFFFEMLRSAIRAFAESGTPKNAKEAIESTRNRIYEQLNTSGLLITIVIWAIPPLGFIGTVLGIAGALQGTSAMNVADAIVRQEATSNVTGSLGMAFDTTLIALVLSIIAMILWYSLGFLQRKQVEDWEEFLNENFTNVLGQQSVNEELRAIIEKIDDLAIEAKKT